jgi:hypothetical protein
MVEAAILELEELGRARRIEKGTRKFIAVNPSLLKTRNSTGVVPEVLAVPAVLGTPEVPEVFEVPDIPEVPDVPEAPDVPGVPEAPATSPEASGTTAVLAVPAVPSHKGAFRVPLATDSMLRIAAGQNYPQNGAGSMQADILKRPMKPMATQPVGHWVPVIPK